MIETFNIRCCQLLESKSRNLFRDFVIFCRDIISFKFWILEDTVFDGGSINANNDDFCVSAFFEDS